VLVLLPFAVAADVTGRVHVIDADTFQVGGERVRLHGIDAPETDQTCRTEQGIVWACGAWAGEQVTALYDGRVARCAGTTRDRYKRLIARCQVDGQDIGQHLVSNGLALAYRRYSKDYVADELQAAARDVGLHAMQMQIPAMHRTVKRTGGSVAPDPGCRIKGNINTRGVRIYHLPGQAHYDATSIRTDRGERWFCSEDEARRAGWRPPLG